MATDAAEARSQNRRYRHRANRELTDENAMAEAEKTHRDKPADGTLFERLTPELSGSRPQTVGCAESAPGCPLE
jgi:hypothetical protein